MTTTKKEHYTISEKIKNIKVIHKMNIFLILTSSISCCAILLMNPVIYDESMTDSLSKFSSVILIAYILELFLNRKTKQFTKEVSILNKI